MATWGAWVTNSSYGAIRLGYDFVQNPGNPAGNFPYSTDHVDTTLIVYLQAQYSINDSSYSFSVWGDWSFGSSIGAVVIPSGGGIVEMGRQTQTRWLSPGSGGRQDFGASISGLYANSATASVGGTNWINARAYGTGQVTIANANTFSMGDSIGVFANRPDASEYIRLHWAFGAASGYIVGSPTTQSQVDTGVWVTDLTTMAAQIPNATSGQGTIWADFYDSGQNYIGTTSLIFTANLPSTVVPTWSGFTVTPDSGTVTAVGSGKYIQNYSNATVTLGSPTAGSGATNPVTTILFNGVPYTGASQVIPVTASGTINVTATVTDSRGRTSTQASTSISSLAYARPTIDSALTYDRCDVTTWALNPMGTSLKIGSSGHVQSLVNGTEKNKLSYVITTQPVGASGGTGLVTQVTYTGTVGGTLTWDSSVTRANSLGNAILANTSYNLVLTITDVLGNTTTATKTVTPGQVAMSISKTGIGVGKVWQTGALDVGGNVAISAGGSDAGNLTVAGSITQNGMPVLGSIALTTDLNSVTATGCYYQSANVNATAGNHYPVALAGLLEVSSYNGGAFVQQRYTTYNGGGSRVFNRGWYVSAWGAWVESVPADTLGVWTSFTPVASASGGGTFTTISTAGRYSVIGKTVDYNFYCMMGNIGSANGYLSLTLPVLANMTVTSLGHGREDASTGAMINAQIVDAWHIGMQKYDNNITVVNGWRIVGSIRYEAA